MLLPFFLGGLVGFVVHDLFFTPTDARLISPTGRPMDGDVRRDIEYVMENFHDWVQNQVSQAKKSGGTVSGPSYGAQPGYSLIPMLGEIPGVYEGLVLYALLMDPQTPWWIKAEIAAVMVYAISPIDLIPDEIPVLGQADDIAILYMGWQHAQDYIEPRHIDQAEQWLRDRGTEPYMVVPRPISEWIEGRKGDVPGELFLDRPGRRGRRGRRAGGETGRPVRTAPRDEDDAEEQMVLDAEYDVGGEGPDEYDVEEHPMATWADAFALHEDEGWYARIPAGEFIVSVRAGIGPGSFLAPSGGVASIPRGIESSPLDYTAYEISVLTEDGRVNPETASSMDAITHLFTDGVGAGVSGDEVSQVIELLSGLSRYGGDRPIRVAPRDADQKEELMVLEEERLLTGPAAHSALDAFFDVQEPEPMHVPSRPVRVGPRDSYGAMHHPTTRAFLTALHS